LITKTVKFLDATNFFDIGDTVNTFTQTW